MQKQCSICNQPVDDFGTKLLWDGVCCRDCVKLASPWLSDEDYRYKTIETFKEHLLYRRENEKKLADFRCDDYVGGKYSLYIDTQKRLFTISKRPNPIKDNADIFELDKITNIDVLTENYEETSGVDLYFEVRLKECEIGKIRFRLNEFGNIEKDSDAYKECMQTAEQYKEHLLSPISGKEIDMSENQGRKRHVVEGTVSEIKKSESGLQSKPVGENRGLLKTISNLFKSKKK